jgi:hypothetical protein
VWSRTPIGPSIGPDRIIIVSNDSIEGRCDLLGATGTAIDPTGGGTFAVTTTVSSLLPSRGGRTLDLVTDTAATLFVTDKKSAQVAFTPFLVTKASASPLAATITDVPGRSVRDIDPSTIFLNGAVPIIKGTAIVRRVLGKDFLFIAYWRVNSAGSSA